MQAARERAAAAIRIGCSGWNYAHWRNGVFYPPRCPARLWLEYYARFFDTVELNTTFYRLPKEGSVARWVVETPRDFVFAVKVSRYLTHVKRLAETEKHLPLLLERIQPLLESPKMGPLLWQLPPTFHRDDERLAESLRHFPRELRNAIEFRHESWFVSEVMTLLREHGVALVIADRAGEVNHFQTHELTTGWTFIRFHHGTRGLRGNYSDAELDEWANRIRGFAQNGDVYAYFNNDWEGFAIRNALGLKKRLGLAARAT